MAAQRISWLKSVTVFLVVALLVATVVACGQKEQETGPQTSAPSITPPLTSQQVVANLLATVDSQGTAKFDLHLVSQVQVVLSSEKLNAKATQDYTGWVDLTNKQLQLTGGGVIEAPDRFSYAVDMYAVGEILYMMFQDWDSSITWMRMEPTQEQYFRFYNNWSMLPWQANLLKTSNVKLLRNETLTGIDCYVLEVEPDINQIWDLVSQPNGFMAGGLIFTSKPTILNDVIRDVSVTAWVDSDTFLPLRFDISLELFTNPPYVQHPEGAEGSVYNELQFTYYDYGTPISITLPSEALGAQEVPWSY